MKSRLTACIILGFLALFSCTKQIDDSILDVPVDELLLPGEEPIGGDESSQNAILAVESISLNGEEVENFTSEILQNDNFISVTIAVGSDVSNVSLDFQLSENATLKFSSTGLNFTGTGIQMFTVVAENGDERTYSLRIDVGDVDPVPSPNEIISITAITDNTTNSPVALENTEIEFIANDIEVRLPFGTALSDLSFAFEITENSTLLDDGQNLNFENGQTNNISLESEDEVIRTYTLVVSVLDGTETGNEIIGITLSTGDAPNTVVLFDTDAPVFVDNTILIEVPFKTDVSAIDVALELSEFAELSMETLTENLDFTDAEAKIFTVEPQSGTARDYSIDVSVLPPTQREALIEMYNPGGFNDPEETGWDLSQGSDIGNWQGVGVDEDGNVISLENENEVEPINFNSFIQYLPYLKSIESNDAGDRLIGNEEFEGIFLENLESIRLFDSPSPNNGLVEIPAFILQQTNITELRIVNMSLSSVQESISDLRNLQTLDLRLNTFTSIPESLAELPNLTTLDISRNFLNLQTIPQAICDWGEIEGHTLIKDEETVCDGETVSVNTQRQALLNMYNENGIIGDNVEPWDTEDFTADWAGVGFDEDGNVISIGVEPDIAPFDVLDENLADLPFLQSIGSASGQGLIFPNELDFVFMNLRNISGGGDGIGLNEIPDWFGNQISLVTLDLSLNDISEIPSNFSQLENLTTLNLSDNNLESIPAFIAELPSLSTLSIGANRILSIPQAICDWGEEEGNTLFKDDEAICDGEITERDALINMYDVSTGLWDLTLEDVSLWAGIEVDETTGSVIGFSFSEDITPIPTFDQNLNYLPNLKTINVFDSSTFVLPREFDYDTSVSQIESITFELTNFEITDWILALPNLETLILGEGSGDFPDDFGDFQALENLTISDNGNDFTFFPESIGNLTTLRTLDISNNEISAVPESLVNLELLESLNLSFNEIDVIPEFLAELPSLTNLNLLGSGSDNLTSIPQVICDWGEEPGNTLEKDAETVCGISQRQALLNMYNGLGLWDLDDQTMESWIGISLDTAGNVTGISLNGDTDSVINGESVVHYPLDNLDSINYLPFLTSISFAAGSANNVPNAITELPENIGELAPNLNTIGFERSDFSAVPESLLSLSELDLIIQDNASLINIPETLCQRFESDANFTLTVTDASTTCDAPLSDENLFTSLSITDANGVDYAEGITDFDVTTIDIEVPYSLDVTNLTVAFTLSPGATTGLVSPLTHNFEGILTVEVQAENGDQHDYDISIIRAPITQREALLSMYDESLDTNNEWDLDADFGTWQGVTVVGGNVTEINFNGFNQDYITLNENLGILTDLERIVLVEFSGSKNVPSVIVNSSFNSLTSISTEFVSFVGSTIPSWITNSTSLTSLNFIETGGLSDISSIGNLINLTSLRFELTDVSEIPSTFRDLNSLISLRFTEENIMEIPDVIGQLTALENLQVQNSRLSTVSTAITGLSNLETLILTGNQESLTSLSFEICEFGETLETFNIDDPSICAEYPESIQIQRDALLSMYTGEPFFEWSAETDMSEWIGVELDVNGNVTELQLDNNGSGSSSIQVFTNRLFDLVYLEVIDSFDGGFRIDENLNPDLDANGKNSLVNLTSISLDNEVFTFLPDWFFSLPNLKSLSGDNSGGFTEIPEEIGVITSLESIDFRGFGINSIPSVIGDQNSLPNLTRFSIEENSGPLLVIPESVCERADNDPNFTLTIDDTAVCEESESIIIQKQALLDLHNGSEESWDINEPLENWEGISLNDDGNVVGIEQNGLIDFIPITEFNENLEFLIHLETFSSVFTNFSEIPSQIGNLNSLTTLNLRGNSISVVSGLDNLTSLTTLDLSVNQIDFISGLDNLASLTTLNLSNNSISAISGLDNLTSLTTLTLANTSIDSLTGLESLLQLEELNMNNVSLIDISGIENLTSLTNLLLNNTTISSIEEIINLTSLTELDLRRNNISSIEGINNLTSLTASFGTLHLSDNLIISVSEEVCEFFDSISTTSLDEGLCE